MSVIHDCGWEALIFCSGCVKVGSATAEAAAQSCPLLSTVNFNYTAVPPVALVPLLKTCPDLKVLKLAGIPNWVSSLNFFELLIHCRLD